MADKKGEMHMENLENFDLTYIIDRFYNAKDKDIDEIMGNILISGMPNEGQITFLKSLIGYSLKRNKAVIIVTNRNSELYNILDCYKNLNSGNDAYKVLSIDFTDRVRSDSFNPFKNLDDIMIKDMVLDMISQYRSLNETEVVKIERYILLTIKIINSLNQIFKFNDLIKYDIDNLLELTEKTSMSVTEKQRIQRFLNEMYQDFIVIESYFDIFNQNGLGDILSGHIGINDIITQKVILMFVLEQLTEPNASNVLLKIIIRLLLQNIPKLTIRNRILLLLEGIIFDSMSDLVGLLKMNFGNKINCAFTVEDVSGLIKESGNKFIDYCKTFAIFTQNSNENCNYWSEFFGTYETIELSYTYSNKHKTLLGQIFGNTSTVVDKQSYDLSNVNANKVAKPIYKPEIFRKLNKKEAIIYFKELNRYKKIMIQ